MAATAAAHGWDRLGGPARAKILDNAADLIERDRSKLMALLVREAGRTIPNALAEVRETADFLRYYAFQARKHFAEPVSLTSTTGETSSIEWRARGPFACIAPWNFPLAIFVGQVAAALAAGQSGSRQARRTDADHRLDRRQAAARSGRAAERASLSARRRRGRRRARQGSARIKGVAFTGSNETAWSIQKALADRRGPIIPFIAETGGLNVMIADFKRLARTDCPRCRPLRLRQRRPAMLGSPRAVPAGRYRRQDDSDADRRHRRAQDRRSARHRDRHRPGHRRAVAGCPRNA